MIDIKKLSPSDFRLMQDLLFVFGEAFHDMPTYTQRMPDERYLGDLLDGESFIALVAVRNSRIIGGLAAYELKKFEQERSEIYIYDLAVLEAYRRQGVAAALINNLRYIAEQRGVYVMFVQADRNEEDEPAIALYSKLGHCEDVFHFDIDVVKQERQDDR